MDPTPCRFKRLLDRRPLTPEQVSRVGAIAADLESEGLETPLCDNPCETCDAARASPDRETPR